MLEEQPESLGTRKLKWEHPFHDSVYIYLRNHRPCGRRFVPTNYRTIISAKIMHQCMRFNIIGCPDHLEVLIRAKALGGDCASCELGIRSMARVTGWLHRFRCQPVHSHMFWELVFTDPPRRSSITAACPFVSSGDVSFGRGATASGSQLTSRRPSPADGALAQVAVVLPGLTVSVILPVANAGRAAGRCWGSEILLMTHEDLISDP